LGKGGSEKAGGRRMGGAGRGEKVGSGRLPRKRSRRGEIGGRRRGSGRGLERGGRS